MFVKHSEKFVKHCWLIFGAFLKDSTLISETILKSAWFQENKEFHTVSNIVKMLVQCFINAEIFNEMMLKNWLKTEFS